MIRGFVITQKGLALLAKLHSGSTLEITRAMIGEGQVSDGGNLRDLEDLVAPVAQATTTKPVTVGTTTSFVVQYRNDLNGGLSRNVNINEYGVFAVDPDEGEILLFYANLGDYYEPVPARGENEPVTAREYPVSIGVAEGVEVILGYMASAYMTAEDVGPVIDAHNNDPTAHPDIRSVAMATQQTLAQTTVPSRTVQMAAENLQAYLDALPRLLMEDLTIEVSGTSAGGAIISNFYGPGKLTITASDANVSFVNSIQIKYCNVLVTLNDLKSASVITDRSTVIANGHTVKTDNLSNQAAGYTIRNNSIVYLLDCTVQNYSNGVNSQSGSLVFVSNCTGENAKVGFSVDGGTIFVLGTTSNTLNATSNSFFPAGGAIITKTGMITA